MEVNIIILLLAALAVGVVVWKIRRKPPETPHAGPDEGDTAWNDPVSARPADDVASRKESGPGTPLT